MAERSVVVRIRAEIGDFRKQMQEASKATAEVGKTSQDTATKSTTALGQMVQSAHKHQQAWETSGRALLGFGAAVSIGVGLAIKSYAEFDKAMSEVKAATHASAGDMELLRSAAIKAGADTSFSAREAADAMAELSKAGVSTKDILTGGLDGALSLAAAGSLDVAQAAEIAASAMTQFGLQGKDIPHIADLLAAGAGKAQGSVQDMGLALSYAGVPAAAMGVSIEQTTGAIALFAKSGIIGEKAGTALRSMFVSMASPTEKTQKLMDKLGISFKDSEGKFIGLDGAGAVLKERLGGIDDMTRNAALAQIFGNEALGAAVSLYKAGADGVQEMTNAVNESGYAAATAAIKQDNLAGDIEKVGGSLDAVFLKSGSGANDVLRSLAQTADGLVDSIGQIPGPVLQAGVGLAAVAGGAALVGGAFLTTFPKIIETKQAFDSLKGSNEKLHGGLSKTAKVAGIATSALAGLMIVGAVSKAMGPAAKTTEDYAQAFLTLNKGTKDLDAVVKNTGGLGTQINGVGDALVRVSDFDWYDNLSNMLGDMVGGTSRTQQFRDSVAGLDNTLVSLVQNGGAEKAGDSFRILAEEADKSAKAQGKAGLSTGDVLKLMPQYTAALKQQATAMGVHLEQADLEQLALGKIPASMEAASKTTEAKVAVDQIAADAAAEHAEALAKIGLNADGTVASLGKLMEAMFAAGLIQLSANEAAIKWQEALEGVDASVAKYGTSLDITTEAGKANRRALDEVAQAGIANTKAMADNGASQGELQKNLRGTYDSLIANYGKFGITGGAADTMARKVLGIPKEAKIDTAIKNYIDSMGKLHNVGAAADSLNGKKVDIYVNTHETTIQKVIRELSGDTDGPTGQGTVLAPLRPKKKAAGGAIEGPGTGTSDDIPAMLSNGEHVLTAAEVQKMGGQAAVYRFRALLDGGKIPKFATGGHLGESANARANRLYRERVAAAKKERDLLLKNAAYRREQRDALYLDDSRGQSYRTVDDSLSSAYSFSDRLRSVANSGNVPGSQRAKLLGRANSSDATLRTLHARSDALGKSLDKAKEKLTDLTQVRAGVASALSGEFSIGKTAQRQGLFGAGAVGNTIADAKGFLAKVQGFAGKLKRLQQKGFSGAIVQEVAALGTTAGTQAADSLLQATSAQVKDLNKTMAAIDTASMAAGNAVTDSMFKGGVAGATAVVKGIESQQGAIGKAMLKIGLGMENALRSALGARPIKRAGGGAVYGPGTSTSDEVPALLSNGEHVLTAEEVRRMGGQRAVYRFRDQLSHGAPSKSLAGGYGQVQSVPGYAPTWGNPAGQAAAGPVTHNWHIADQSNPVATSHEVTRRLGALRT